MAQITWTARQLSLSVILPLEAASPIISQYVLSYFCIPQLTTSQVDQSGTYWYHSHTKGQYPDGFRQVLTISDPKDPYVGKYDEERMLTLSDWYHDQMPSLLKGFISVTNPTGAEPVPKAALMNDTQNLTMSIQPGKTYLFRMVNIGAFASQYFWIEGHTMKIVEVDGIWTEPAEADMIYIASAQRYSFLVTMKNDTSRNYPMVGSMDTVRLFCITFEVSRRN